MFPVGMLIGICGGSGSGKTTLADMVAAELGPTRAASLAFDNYYRDLTHLTFEERVDTNFDHPDSLDVELFVNHLLALREGHEVAVPIYDFATHTRTTNVHILEPKPVVVVEGILLLAYPELADVFDLSVYRSCPEAIRFERRVERDIAERGRTPESVREQFDATVKPMHDQFVAPSRAHADIVTDHVEELHDACNRVMAAIDELAPALR